MRDFCEESSDLLRGLGPVASYLFISFLLRSPPSVSMTDAASDSPDLAFIRENINILREFSKESLRVTSKSSWTSSVSLPGVSEVSS